MSKQSKQLDFESAMTKLESLITQMEQDDLSLDAALKNFEKGISLTRICQSSLNNAEQRIKILTQGIEEDFLINEP
ncbi:MAG TPA: exodeoxyribonuclease VII small subunit [Leucothrix mucor]|uniref:Exodeoxyribonuclease 7 small subunit n=1 Tax=Leucothrix mucor TaxID=45248 RepID=A0A7V2WUS1_LEUMU|nr:exodeoxyribonuclease VII small subunit [Leucothrix mucor]